MSDPRIDLFHRNAMLGETLGDLARSQAGHAVAVMQANSANRRAEEAEEELAKTKRELAEAQELILDWMHTNQAFKLLARKYGKQLKISDEQRQNDFDELILDVAEENPKLQNTPAHHRVKAKRAAAPK